MGRVEFCFEANDQVQSSSLGVCVWKRDGNDDDRKKITPSTRTFRQQSALLVRVRVRICPCCAGRGFSFCVFRFDRMNRRLE